ncbi:MAG: hypothetical protein AB8B65_00675 [Kordia sp.]|uniref:hypothetical protein n=1 Tax=Kordia sp. TaxID=1965332 RepID=UPI00385EEA14
MKKKTSTLMLNKKSISNLDSAQILGGNKDKFTHFTSFRLCKTKCCSSKLYEDCTVTYIACASEPRFCGAF